MHAQLISVLALHHSIGQSDITLINQAFEEKTFLKGDVLSGAGRVCRELFFVNTGIARIFRINEKGDEVTHVFIPKNKFCTILESFNCNTVSYDSIQACTDVQVLVISYVNLHKLYAQIPYLKALIAKIQQQSLLDKVQLQNAFKGYDSSKRYELFLKLLPEIALYVSQGDIASYLEITPQSLSRIKKNR